MWPETGSFCSPPPGRAVGAKSARKRSATMRAVSDRHDLWSKVLRFRTGFARSSEDGTSKAKCLVSDCQKGVNFMGYSGGGRESNPPGILRPLTGFEDRGTHQASGRLRGAG
jgi:hypothetical protein